MAGTRALMGKNRPARCFPTHDSWPDRPAQDRDPAKSAHSAALDGICQSEPVPAGAGGHAEDELGSRASIHEPRRGRRGALMTDDPLCCQDPRYRFVSSAIRREEFVAILARMDDTRLGRLVRALRRRRGWRQVDLAAKAGVGRSVVSQLEIGRFDARSVATVRQIFETFGLTYEGGVRGLGADADRLLDERHSTLLGACARWLRDLAWKTAAEVSYSEWGERGSVDLLAWHEATSTLLVVEIKTELASVEATLRKHDEKARLAKKIAGPLGWHASKVNRLLVFPEDRTQRRRVLAHESVMLGAYPVRGHRVRAWCRAPVGTMSGLLFLSDSTPSRGMVDRGPGHRVRKATAAGRTHE